MAGLLPKFSGVLGLPGTLPKEGGNTTSTTKIIDGHVVTVNETTYNLNDGDDDKGIHAIYHVRTVEVSPQKDSTEGTDGDIDNGGGEIETSTDETTPNNTGKTNEENTTQARSVETVENINDNKIPKNDIESLTA